MSFQSGSPLVTHLILPSPLEVGRSKPQRREVKCLAQAGWGRGRGACPWSVLGDVNPYNSGTILLGGDVFAEGLRSNQGRKTKGLATPPRSSPAHRSPQHRVLPSRPG